jgi:hypothetical protein
VDHPATTRSCRCRLRHRSAAEAHNLEWKATGGGRRIEDGIDTFIFQDGMIRVQTVVYTVS